MASAKHAHGSGAAHGGHHHGAEARSWCGGQHGGGDKEPGVAVDPVCGMSVKRETAKHRLEYGGEEYLFCGPRCRERFAADPAKFLKPREPEPAAPAGTIYTCPMHPQVRQVGPGSCPICGMALEPEQVSLDDAPAHSTTGVESAKEIQFDHKGGTRFIRPRWPPISIANTGRVSTSAIQNRLVMSINSGSGASSSETCSGSSAMPQIGQLPGPTCRTCGCIGQV